MCPRDSILEVTWDRSLHRDGVVVDRGTWGRMNARLVLSLGWSPAHHSFFLRQAAPPAAVPWSLLLRWAYSEKAGGRSASRIRSMEPGEAWRAPALRSPGQAQRAIGRFKQPLYLLVGSTLPRFEVGQRSFANEPQYPHLSVDNLRLPDPPRAAAHDLEPKRS